MYSKFNSSPNVFGPDMPRVHYNMQKKSEGKLHLFIEMLVK